MNRLEGVIFWGLEYVLVVNFNELMDEEISLIFVNCVFDINEFMDFGEWDFVIGEDGIFDLLNVLVINLEVFLMYNGLVS